MAGALWACDLPTEAPKLEQEWFFPLVETSVDVGELLPSNVDLTPDGTAFTVQVDPIFFQEDLGALCQACQGKDGLTVPKPPFEGEFDDVVDLPADVASVQVREGRVTIEAVNGFSFDPLRPPGGDRGSFTLVLRDGGSTGSILDEVVVDGEESSFASGATLSRELEYSGAVGSMLWVGVFVDSPEGGPEPGNWVTIRLSDEIQVTLIPETIEAESAEINVANETFQIPVTNLDVEDIQEDVVDRITRGALDLQIVNPWSVGAVLTLTVDGPTLASPVVLIAPVPASPTATVQVEFSQAELQSFLGEPDVILTGQGTVSSDAGTAALAPGQEMSIEARLDLVVTIG